MSGEAEESYSDMNFKVIYIPGQCTTFLHPSDSIIMNSFRAERKSIGVMLLLAW